MNGHGAKDQEPVRGFFRADLLAVRLNRKCACSFALLATGLLSFVACAAEPNYEGKSASFWLDHIDASPNGMNETVKAFKAMGSNAVPFLIKTLERKPSKLGEVVDEKLYQDDLERHLPKGVVRALPSAMRVEDRREHAAFLISQIGPDAAAAIPALMAVLTDQTEGWRIEAEVRGGTGSDGGETGRPSA